MRRRRGQPKVLIKRTQIRLRNIRRIRQLFNSSLSSAIRLRGVQRFELDYLGVDRAFFAFRNRKFGKRSFGNRRVRHGTLRNRKAALGLTSVAAKIVTGRWLGRKKLRKLLRRRRQVLRWDQPFVQVAAHRIDDRALEAIRRHVKHGRWFFSLKESLKQGRHSV